MEDDGESSIFQNQLKSIKVDMNNDSFMFNESLFKEIISSKAGMKLFGDENSFKSGPLISILNKNSLSKNILDSMKNNVSISHNNPIKPFMMHFEEDDPEDAENYIFKEEADKSTYSKVPIRINNLMEFDDLKQEEIETEKTKKIYSSFNLEGVNTMRHLKWRNNSNELSPAVNFDSLENKASNQ